MIFVSHIKERAAEIEPIDAHPLFSRFSSYRVSSYVIYKFTVALNLTSRFIFTFANVFLLPG